MRILGCFVVLVAASVASADYTCVCNHDVELEVFESMSESSNAFGTLAPNACKEQLSGIANPGWYAVAFQHRAGYLQTTNNIVVQQCTGNPPATDTVSTASSSGTTAIPVSTTSGMMKTSGTSGMMTTSGMKTTTTGMMTTTSGMMTTSQTTYMPVVSTTSGQQTVISGNLNLCPVALRSFAAKDGGILAQYDQSCYEVVPYRHSWTYAENDCKTKGGHLVDITSAAEQDFIFKFLQAKYPHNMWIGLHDINVEGKYQWASGAPVSYTNWLAGRSTTYHSYTDCVYLRPQNGGYWNEGGCSSSRPLYTPHAYLCQYDIDTTSHGTANPLGDGDSHMCPSVVQQHASRFFGNLGQYKQSCYELLPRYKVTWSHGERLCQQEGGHLVTIGDADEQSFIQEFMTRHMPTHAVWTGLNDRQTENQFEWSSGQPVTYTHWATDHTSNFVSHHLEDCAIFVPYHNGLWDDVTCGTNSIFGDRGETHPILCEFRGSNSTGGTGVQIIG